MELNNTIKKSLFALTLIAITFLFYGCSISYKFNGSNIDYSKVKSISISDFPNTAELVYPALAMNFSEALRDAYTKQTHLQILKKGGNMHLEGEIVGYQLTPMAIGKDAYSTETKLTITINVRFSNSKNPEDDFEKKYSASQNYNASKRLEDVQEELTTTILSEIVDNIFNDTVAKW